jgi:hypothetical protein
VAGLVSPPRSERRLRRRVAAGKCPTVPAPPWMSGRAGPSVKTRCPRVARLPGDTDERHTRCRGKAWKRSGRPRLPFTGGTPRHRAPAAREDDDEQEDLVRAEFHFPSHPKGARWARYLPQSAHALQSVVTLEASAHGDTLRSCLTGAITPVTTFIRSPRYAVTGENRARSERWRMTARSRAVTARRSGTTIRIGFE